MAAGDGDDKVGEKVGAGEGGWGGEDDTFDRLSAALTHITPQRGMKDPLLQYQTVTRWSGEPVGQPVAKQSRRRKSILIKTVADATCNNDSTFESPFGKIS